MPLNGAAIKTFLQNNPAIASALIGTVIGAPTGALFSDRGEEGRGALQGALLGGALGTAGGKGLHYGVKIVPSAEKALATGAIAGGVAGGYAGKRSISPWVIEHWMSKARGEGKKEAADVSTNNQTKQAAEAEKQAAEKTQAFEFGVAEYCRRQGITHEEFAKEAHERFGVPPDKLTDAMIEWLEKSLTEQK